MTDDGAIRVGIVDDQDLVRAGFRMILSAEDDLTVVGEAGDGATAVELAASEAVDVLLMDLRMPHMDGLEATRRVTARPGAPRVLILTTFDTEEYVYEALRAGASGFLLKTAPPARLVEAVRLIHAGEALLAPSITRRLIETYLRRTPESHPPPELARLTEREHDVLVALAEGLSNTEIANRFVVSEATIKTHVNRIFAKLGVRDRVQAVVFAYQSGVVRVGGTDSLGQSSPAAGWTMPDA
jgi:DNA-binding NarL/FixJ family response regulator